MPCVYHESPAEIQEREQRELNRHLTPLHTVIDVLKQELAERDAMLCGVFTLFENGVCVNSSELGLNDILSQVNWKEAGVTEAQTHTWWEDHKLKDEARQQAEAAVLAARRTAALVKLTPAERELLGLE
jgi:hypothetical protein